MATPPQASRRPSCNTIRAIYAQGLGRTNLDFTANVSASWFSEVRPGMSGGFATSRPASKSTRSAVHLISALFAYRRGPLYVLAPGAAGARARRLQRRRDDNEPGHIGAFSPSSNSRRPTTPCGFRCRSPTRIGRSSSTRATFGGRSASRSISMRSSWIGRSGRGRRGNGLQRRNGAPEGRCGPRITLILGIHAD